MQGRGRIVRPRHPKWGLQMKYIFVPLLVALAGWGIRPASADDIHDALDRADSAYGSGDYGRAKRAADPASALNDQQELQILVDTRFLVTVSGDAPEEAKLTYASGIELSALK